MARRYVCRVRARSNIGGWGGWSPRSLAMVCEGGTTVDQARESGVSDDVEAFLSTLQSHAMGGADAAANGRTSPSPSAKATEVRAGASDLLSLDSHLRRVNLRCHLWCVGGCWARVGGWDSERWRASGPDHRHDCRRRVTHCDCNRARNLACFRSPCSAAAPMGVRIRSLSHLCCVLRLAAERM